jgi:hypothetical protein
MPSTTTTTCSSLKSRFLCSRLAQAVRFVSRRRRGCASWGDFHKGSPHLVLLHDRCHGVSSEAGARSSSPSDGGNSSPSKRIERYLILIEAGAHRDGTEMRLRQDCRPMRLISMALSGRRVSWSSNRDLLATGPILAEPQNREGGNTCVVKKS